MEKSKSLTQFLIENLWGILTLLVLFGSFSGIITFRLNAVEAKAKENKESIDKLTNLVERVIVLEQHDRSIYEDIAEIKGDLREIKTALIR